MAAWGTLVLKWPFVPGCDAGGMVVKAGKNAISALGDQFKEGDKVFGCTRLGTDIYSTFQEYVRLDEVLVCLMKLNLIQFIMDSKLTVPVPKNLELIQASTLGVAAYVSHHSRSLSYLE
jgi:NADPH:quinone reductase-like Zn-dependent oxidoreductase